MCRSARLEPYLFPEDEVGLRNDIERMCIAVEKLSGMSTVTFKSCVERTASWYHSFPPSYSCSYQVGEVLTDLAS